MFLVKDRLPPHGETDGHQERPSFKENDFPTRGTEVALPRPLTPPGASVPCQWRAVRERRAAKGQVHGSRELLAGAGRPLLQLLGRAGREARAAGPRLQQGLCAWGFMPALTILKFLVIYLGICVLLMNSYGTA